VRKFSRRTTIFMVALGVLLTASLAFAAVLATGSDSFTAHVAGEPPTASLDVVVTTDGSVDLGPELTEEIIVTVTNNNHFAVTLGVPAEGGDPTPAVQYDITAPPGSEDCTEDDLQIADDEPWDGLVLAADGGTNDDDVLVSLTESGLEDCAGVDIQITVTVSGVGPEGTEEGATLVRGTGRL
jgi:hypothetical protein